MRAANRVGGTVGSAANTTAKQIDRVARELTEVTTKVETGGSPAPNVVPDPLPGRSNDPVPTTPNKPTGCFIAGTDILTPDGMKDIETVQVGDLVMADDPSTPGDVQERRVTQIFQHEVSTLIDLTIDGEVITTTEEHPFWVPDLGWVKAKDLQEGTTLQTDDGAIVDIDHIEKRNGNFTVYNFEVEGFHSYFVSDLGILVHNTCPWREEPILTDKGWKHIDERHVTGNDPNKGPGDLFPPGTTREQLEDAAKKVIKNGTRVSDPSRTVQTFEDRIVVNGMRDRVRVVIDSSTGEVITIFPVRSE
jgi:hypothetical protein